MRILKGVAIGIAIILAVFGIGTALGIPLKYIAGAVAVTLTILRASMGLWFFPTR